MELLDSTVRTALRGVGIPDASALSAITHAWAECVGPAIARQAWPLRLNRDGTLRVACSSSTWAFELGRMAPEILERLRATLGDAAPASLRFAPGPVPAPGADAEQAVSPPGPSAADLERAASLTAAIEDPELRDLATRAIAASLASAGPTGRSGILR